MDIAELDGVDGVGGLAHEVDGAVVLGEGNDLSDGFAFSDEHDHAVQAEGDAAVGGRAEGERGEQVCEALVDGLLVQSEGAEGGVLEVALMDTQGTAAELVAVEDDIVGLGAEVG